MADGLRRAAGGWYVTYGVPTSNHEPRLQECTENSVTLKGLIPDADYTISLTPADGADVFGTVEASARTPSGGRFDRYGATPSTTYISLWETAAGGQLGLPLPDDVQDLLLSG